MQECDVQWESCPLADIPDPILARMYGYWVGKCAGRPFPDRGDIDPLDFPWALGNVCLLDVDGVDPPRFRYRLQGSNLTKYGNGAMTGRTVDQLRPRSASAMMQRHFREVVETRKPTLYRIRMSFTDHSFEYLRLALPLSHGGEGVAMIMTIGSYSQPLEDFFRRLTASGDPEPRVRLASHRSSRIPVEPSAPAGSRDSAAEPSAPA